MAQARYPVAVDDFGRPFPIDEGTSNLQRSPTPGPLGTDHSRLEEELRFYIDRLEHATDWHTVDHYAAILLGPQSFALGVLAGIVANLVGSVVQLLKLVADLVLADIYERAEEKPGWYVWRYGGHWSAELVQMMFPETLAEAHGRKEALLKDLSYAFHHPGEFFSAFGHEYVVKYHRFLAAMSSGTASGQFTAGKIIGELLLDILAVIGVGEAAAKWAGKIPELARIAKSLTRPVEIIKPLEGGGAAVDAAADTRSPYQIARAAIKRLSYRPTSGAVLETTPGRTTTILGSYASDMKSVVGELGNVTSTDLGPRVGDFNVLNVPQSAYSPATFWEDWNQPWLQNAIDRNDVITLATDPTPDVLTRLDAAGNVVQTGFGKEVQFLQDHNYIFEPLSHRMVPTY